MDYINEFNTSHYYIFQSIHFPFSGQRFFFFLTEHEKLTSAHKQLFNKHSHW